MKKEEDKQSKKVQQYREVKEVFPDTPKHSRWEGDIEVPAETRESRYRVKIERKPKQTQRDRNEGLKLYTLEEAKAICKAECDAKKKPKKKKK